MGMRLLKSSTAMNKGPDRRRSRFSFATDENGGVRLGKPMPRLKLVVLVREQDGQAHTFQHVTRDTTQDHLAQARVAVAAHDQKVGVLSGGLH
jgi:hypothetical protein